MDSETYQRTKWYVKDLYFLMSIYEGFPVSPDLSIIDWRNEREVVVPRTKLNKFQIAIYNKKILNFGIQKLSSGFIPPFTYR